MFDYYFVSHWQLKELRKMQGAQSKQQVMFEASVSRDDTEERLPLDTTDSKTRRGEVEVSRSKQESEEHLPPTLSTFSELENTLLDNTEPETPRPLTAEEMQTLARQTEENALRASVLAKIAGVEAEAALLAGSQAAAVARLVADKQLRSTAAFVRKQILKERVRQEQERIARVLQQYFDSCDGEATR